MPTNKVIVTGRIPAPDQSPSLPPPTYPLAPLPRQRMQEVELIWPATCPCCGEPVKGQRSLRLNKAAQSWVGISPSMSASWEVPYCERCCQHVALKQQRPTSSVIIEIITILTVLIAVFSVLSSNAFIAALLFLGIVLAGLFANARVLRKYEQDVVRPVMCKTCVAPGPALIYQGWNDDRTRHAFLFHDENYGRLFASLNHSQDIFQVK